MSLKSYKKSYESIEDILKSLGSFDLTPYDRLTDEERCLFDKLAENNFGKQENIVHNIENIGSKALYLFGGLFVTLEFLSEMGLMGVGTSVGAVSAFLSPIALYLLIFSLFCLFVASVYKGIILFRKNDVLREYSAVEKSVENAAENSDTSNIKDSVREKLSQTSGGSYAKKSGLLIAFESIQELRESVYRLRDKYTNIKEKMGSQARYSNPLYSNLNIRNQCDLYIDYALGLLSDDSLGVIIDAIMKPRVDIRHRQYSNFFLNMLSKAAQGGENKDEDDEFTYLNDSKSREFQERTKDLLSSDIADFSDGNFPLLESQYRAVIVHLEEAIVLFERMNDCLGDPEHVDLSQYERAMQEEARERSSVRDAYSLPRSSIPMFSMLHDKKGGGAIEDECAEHTVTHQPVRSPSLEPQVLIKTPIVDVVDVIARVESQSHQDARLFANCRAVINLDR